MQRIYDGRLLRFLEIRVTVKEKDVFKTEVKNIFKGEIMWQIKFIGLKESFKFYRNLFKKVNLKE